MQVLLHDINGGFCITYVGGVYKDATRPKYIVRSHDVHSVAHHRDREFMAALGSNTSLLDVDLTSNLIGKQEIGIKVCTSVTKRALGQFYLEGFGRCSTMLSSKIS